MIVPGERRAAVDAQHLEASVTAQQPLVAGGDARLFPRRDRAVHAGEPHAGEAIAPAPVAPRARYRERSVRLVEPAHNVELRADRHGHAHVVFAFPYRADIVDAVRAIPGRRFDWDAKEWWAPQADTTAPYVKGVIERHGSLLVAPEVTAWLAEAASGWVGRVGAARLHGRGAFMLETISGELPEELAAIAEVLGGRLWLPFSQATADALLELRGARLDQRALRCATLLQVGDAPPPATLAWSRASASRASRSTSTGIPTRFPPSSRSRPARRTAARCRSTRTWWSRSSTTCAPTASPSRRTRGRRWTACGSSTTTRSRTSGARAPHDGPPLAVEAVLGGELRPFQRAGVDYVVRARRAFLADEQGLGKTVQALAALEADAAYPALVLCPASLKLNWQREAERWLPHRSSAVVSGTRHRRAGRGHHDHQLRDRARAPPAAGAAAPARARARRVPLRQEPARQAHAGRAPARREPRARRAAARAHRHAGAQPRRGADRAAADPRAGWRTSARAPASPAASRASGRRSGSTGTCAGAASSAAPRPTCCPSCPRSATSPCPSRSTTSASTGSPRRA